MDAVARWFNSAIRAWLTRACESACCSSCCNRASRAGWRIHTTKAGLEPGENPPAGRKDWPHKADEMASRADASQPAQISVGFEPSPDCLNADGPPTAVGATDGFSCQIGR